MTIDHRAYARECLERWPAQVLLVDGAQMTPRAKCTTCSCYTIPVHLVHDESGNGECAIKAPGKYPCPVCGQVDQYIMVWITARARHHAVSQRSLRERGYVSHIYGPLRAPLEAELPNPSAEPFTGFRNISPIASAQSLLVRPGDPRFVPATTEEHAAHLDCAACRALVGE